MTFSVTFCPYLATQVLRHVARTHEKKFPRVAQTVETTFYVDGSLTRAKMVEKAVEI